MSQGGTNTTQIQGSCGVRMMSLQPLFPSSPLDHSPKPTLDSTSGELTGGPDWDHGGAGLRPLQQRGPAVDGGILWSRGHMLICQQRVTQWAASSECWWGPTQPEPRAGTYELRCSRARWRAANEENVHVRNHTGSKTRRGEVRRRLRSAT